MEITVNANLYEFMKNNELSIYQSYKDSEIISFIRVNFFDLEEFINIFPENSFDENMLHAQIGKYDICFDLIEVMEYFGHEIKDYYKCFDNYKEIWSDLE